MAARGEGYWLNPKTNQHWEVHEHCMHVKDPRKAQEMGIPAHVLQEIAPLHCDFNGAGREAIVVAVMKAGYIRVRRHGAQTTCEFWGNTKENMWASYMFVDNYIGGDFNYVVINNLKTKEQWAGNLGELRKQIKEDDDNILRMAKALIWQPKNPGIDKP